MVSGLAQAFHFATRNELNTTQLAEILEAGPMASRVSKVKSRKLVENDFDVQASISNVLENSRLIAHSMTIGIEIVLAAMISGLALIALPRKSVRRRLAESRRTLRVRYVALFLVPTWLLAAFFWVDIWRRVGRRGSEGEFQSALIAAGIVWGLLLGLAALPDVWRGRSSALRVPSYWLWGEPLYRGGIRAVPSMMVVLLLEALSVVAIPLNQSGIIRDWMFLTLFFAAVVAVLTVVSVIMFNWPTFVVPPSMRRERGAIQESLHARRQPRPPFNRRP